MALTGYFGFPNFLPATLKSAYKLNDQKKEQLEIRRPAPFGLNISYLVNDNVAIGGEISYEQTQIKWREKGTYMGNDSTNILFNHHYALNVSRVRLLVILDYHFAIRKHSDLYFGFGIGYSHNTTNLNTRFPHTSYHNIPRVFCLSAHELK